MIRVNYFVFCIVNVVNILMLENKTRNVVKF